MSKKEFVRKISEKSGCTITDCKKILDTILEEIVNTVKEEGEMRFLGFASFKKYTRPARTMNSSLLGREVEVKEKNMMKVKFSPVVIDKLNS